MEIGQIIPHIEALIFASDRPLTSMEITELINNAFGFMDDKITLEQVSSAIDGIVGKYESDFYSFEVRESGGGWQFLTKKDYHKTIAQINGDKFLKRLSNAALETLAIIAYKQPVTKADIEGIRGVSSDYSIQKLLEKELIVITGRNEELPGKPLVYATSKSFMDYFGLNSPDDLPKLQEIYQEAVNPTDIVPQVHREENTEESEFESSSLSVTDKGELTGDLEDEETGENLSSTQVEVENKEEDVEEGQDEIGGEDYADDDNGDEFEGNDEEKEVDDEEEDDDDDDDVDEEEDDDDDDDDEEEDDDDDDSEDDDDYDEDEDDDDEEDEDEDDEDDDEEEDNDDDDDDDGEDDEDEDDEDDDEDIDRRDN